MKNQKSRAKYFGKVMSELKDLPEEAQDQAMYHLHIRIKELKQENANKYSHNHEQSTDYRTRRAL
ncbi:MAG: hypothetical protein IKK29_05925 [Christensenellaceae bacterium]|nr:hypothetical protein [Christensenellaceae bacterium]